MYKRNIKFLLQFYYSFTNSNFFYNFEYYIIVFKHILYWGEKYMNNNMDMAKLMNMLSKMDKKDLEQGLNKVSQMLKNKDAESIINEIKKNK